ncbi:MAG: hypothetical protein ACJAS1_004517 [Oleiphilaceae bacterium]|jgi:hypothetical protein
MMKKMNAMLAVLSMSSVLYLGGCASMVGLTKPGPQTVLVEGENGKWFAEGEVTEITLQEYRDNTKSEGFGRGLVQGAAGLLGPLGSMAAAGGDMAYESQRETKTFPILTIKVGDKEVQLIQSPNNEGYEHVVIETDFKVGDKVRIEADQNTPPHAIKLAM